MKPHNAHTLLSYTSLPDTEKQEYLSRHGVHLDERLLRGKTVILYQVHAYYVEVYYNRNNHKLEKLTCFSDTEALQPYLENIDIQEIKAVLQGGAF